MRSLALLLAPVLLLPACAADGDASRGPDGAAPQASSDDGGPRLAAPTASASVVPGTTAAELATGTSAALFASAPLVLLAGEGDAASQQRAAALSATTGAPVLLAPTDPAKARPVAEEVARLEPEAVLAVGEAAAGWAEQHAEAEVVTAPATGEGLPDDLPASEPAEPLDGVVVLHEQADSGVDGGAALATATAAGAELVAVPGADPRADAATVQRLAELRPAQALGLGSSFGDDAVFAERVATAATGVELPGGGQLVLAGKRYVALYGHPGTAALGVLGEQGPQASADRAQALAEQYADVRPDTTFVPSFEVIATVASSSAGADGDFSSESTLEHLRPYVDAAADAGAYVLLDLQPGTTDFLTQARRYEELLRLPHVGLALDPEWRLAPGQRHLAQIGSVGADEVNQVSAWLAELVRRHDLPQKMLLLHQFRTSMLQDRGQIVADRDELAVVTQMDGHGPPSLKNDTWQVLLRDPPTGMSFGWKNFYDEDKPMLTPAQTMAVEPTPVFVSFQ